MNILTAFQGVDTAFSITLSPSTVDFPAAPALVGEIHRGDGRAALATLTPTWANTATDLITVPIPGTVTATLEPGGYFLSVRPEDSSTQLSFDVLNILASPGGLAPLRSLVAPSEAVQLLPDLLPNLPQFSALPDLLASATELIEAECERKLILADFDGAWAAEPYGYSYIDLEFPVISIASVSTGPSGWPIVPGDFAATTRYDLNSWTGKLRVDPYYWSGSGDRIDGRLIRVVYRGGYAIEPADIALGLEAVPRPLRKACCMVARSIQEGALTAGPVKTQTVRDRSYTKTENPLAVMDEIMPLIRAYKRNWVVA